MHFALKKIIKLIQIVQKKSFRKALLKTQVAASVEHAYVLNNLSKAKFRTIVDIGANKGQFTLIARNYFPSAEIFSFEPLQEPAKKFREVFMFDTLVSLHEVAIGPTRSSATIHVSSADDSSSLLPISPLQNNLFPGTAEKETRIIQVKPLNHILDAQDIKKPALLKMDVQGFEKEALEGCRLLLSSFAYIYVECSFMELYDGQALAHEVISFLAKFSFKLTGIYNLEYDKFGDAIQGDFLFKNESVS